MRPNPSTPRPSDAATLRAPFAARLCTKAATLCTLAVVVLLSSCSAPIKDTGPVSTFQQEGGGYGFGGDTVVNTVTTNATIVAVYSTNRTVVLKYPDGRMAPYKAGAEVVNFGLLKVGDEVQTTVGEEMGVAVAKAGAPLSRQKTTSVLKGPDGKVHGIVTTQNLTGTVLNVDPDQRELALQVSGGQTRTIKVLDMVDISDVHPGDEVTVNISEARTFAIQKQ